MVDFTLARGRPPAMSNYSHRREVMKGTALTLEMLKMSVVLEIMASLSQPPQPHSGLSEISH